MEYLRVTFKQNPDMSSDGRTFVNKDQMFRLIFGLYTINIANSLGLVAFKGGFGDLVVVSELWYKTRGSATHLLHTEAFPSKLPPYR